MAHNLEIIMCRLLGMGTARSLQAEGGLATALHSALFIAVNRLRRMLPMCNDVSSVPFPEPKTFFSIALAS